jgi:hypothetical protein
MEITPKTIEQIRKMITTARDSVWVIGNEIEKITSNGSLNKEGRAIIKRNVEHLQFIVADTEIVESGEEIGDLSAAITIGEQALQNNPEQ